MQTTQHKHKISDFHFKAVSWTYFVCFHTVPFTTPEESAMLAMGRALCVLNNLMLIKKIMKEYVKAILGLKIRRIELGVLDHGNFKRKV